MNRLIENLRTSKYVYGISSLYENKRHFIAFIRQKGTPYLFLYSKTSNKVMVKNSLSFPNDGVGLLSVGVHGDHIIGIIRYSEIEKIKEKLENGTPDEIASLKAEGLDLASTIGQSYNPIISLYKLNEL